MQLSCEVCHSSLRAEDVRLDLAVARCHACNAVYDLSGRKARGLPEQQRPQRFVRAKAVLPKRFRVEEDDSTTRISWRWLSTKHAFMAFFCVAWNSGLLGWYFMALTMAKPPLIVIIFPIVHVITGVWLTYNTLAGFVNRTRIEVNRTRLSIRHGPLPWPGSRELSRREITQLYGEEVFTASGETDPSATYNLLALDQNERKVKLIGGLQEKDQVLYLEQALERRLGIEDVPVDGEVATRAVAI